MSRALRRARGALLRIAVRRRTGVLAGAVLVACAAVPVLGDFGWERWWTDGLALIAGASGAALVLAGVAARGPDWIDPPDP